MSAIPRSTYTPPIKPHGTSKVLDDQITLPRKKSRYRTKTAFLLAASALLLAAGLYVDAKTLVEVHVHAQDARVKVDHEATHGMFSGTVAANYTIETGSSLHSIEVNGVNCAGTVSTSK